MTSAGISMPESRVVLPLISVVIPTRNRRTTLGLTLCNLLAQDCPKEQFEVIVVDDGSTDGTSDLVSDFVSEFASKGGSIRVLDNPSRGAATARNLGVASASGEIVAFTDDDVFLSKNYLSEIERAMRPGVDGVYGRIVTDFVHFMEPLMTTSINKRYLTACSAYRKQSLLAVGAFSPKFPFHRGDSVLAYKILERGGVVEYAPDAVLYHPLRKFRTREIVDAAKWSTYDPLLLREHGGAAKVDVLAQVVPRLTPEGAAFIVFAALVSLTSLFFTWAAGGVLAGILILGAILALAKVRSSYKGKPWGLRLVGATISLLLYFAAILGRLVGSVRYRSFII